MTDLKLISQLLFCCIINICCSLNSISQSKSLPVYLNEKGTLIYTPDSLGNRIPDFSYCGYMAGEQPISKVPIKVIVPNYDQDATLRIQNAIDYIASLEPDENGFRGTVLLEKGVFELNGRLTISVSGIVLRGSGTSENRTKLVAKGTDRETLIKISGKNNLTTEKKETIMDDYIPVNSFTVHVGANHSLKTGDNILIHRPATQKWIDELGMNEFGGETDWLGWKPERVDIFWDMKIKNVNKNAITFDSPITTALDKKFGESYMIRYSWPGRIEKIGIENLCIESEYDINNPKDEDHCWMAITIENAKDVWVRQVSFKHFAGSAVAIYETAKRVTVEDCISTTPVSEIGGQRRYTFFTNGQQTLFQRCYAEYGYHDFAVGFCAAGPNAFVQCESHLSFSFSGTIDSWASGVLFDIVYIDGQALSFKNRHAENHGAGWTAANSMLWQCSASQIDCEKPSTAQNWAFGAWGQFSGNGFWYEANSHVKPRSFYYAQLSDRIGNEALNRAHLLPLSTEATSSPTIDQAILLSANSAKPPLQLKEWTEKASEREPFNNFTHKIKTIDKIGLSELKALPKQSQIQIKNGWIICNDKIVTGITVNNQWWRGNIKPYAVSKAKPHITRFVPGRTGTGYTDDLSEVVNWMDTNHIVAFNHNYGLWYDRRRDDHERIRRMNGEVWPPFYELPFARSGEETAWDGLSKYDLNKYNVWYWSRLKQFADLAEIKGYLLIHQNYFQHNILEAGAHWADFPWRSANNINNTGFPEPPPYAGDKRIFMAEQFYDVYHPIRKELHKAYIRKCLNNFAENSNVIQMTSNEYTGPLHFVEFWIDVITDWEKETGKNAIIGLSTTKDVQDAILIDPIRSKAIEVIDIKYWHYRDDSTVYAPEGGKNLAPRQHARLEKTGKSDFDAVYRAVNEYKTKYPEKAVIYSSNGLKNNEWAVFMAGGSLAGIPKIKVSGFLESAASMHPIIIDGNIKALSNNQKEYIIYSQYNDTVKVDLTDTNGNYVIYIINPDNGLLLKEKQKIKGGEIIELVSSKDENIVIWIVKE